MTNEACENTFEVMGAGGAWLEETLQVFVLELIEPVCGTASLQPTAYTPRISTEETADEFV